MLLATPFVNFDKVLPKSGAPRIISEIRKPEIGLHREQNRARLSGDLLVKCANEQQWWPRRVTIRGGQLLVGCAHGDVKPSNLRILLRRLSLSAGSLPNSLSLIRGQNVVLTIQASSESAFDLWVKAIAIELIRQTPLEDVKYFDILTLNDCWNRKETDQENDWNFNCLKENIPKRCNTCDLANRSLIRGVENTATRTSHLGDDSKKRTPVAPVPQTHRLLNNSTCKTEKVPLRFRSRSCNSAPKEADKRHALCDINSNYLDKPPQIVVHHDKTVTSVAPDATAVEVLLKKCQNPESYVPVKEKLFLFETLCRLGRKVRSSENVSLKVDVITKRARSLHDLHSFTNTGVREICKYFENKTEKRNKCDTACNKTNRLVYSDTSLNVCKGYKSIRNLQNASYA